MVSTKIAPIAGIAATLIFLAIQTFVPRLPIAERRLVPVETFPRQVGDWTCREEQPIDKEVAERCPTAHFVQRIYQDRDGNEVQLLLMTATGADDIHDPTICFPSQGWLVESQRDRVVAGQKITDMATQQNGTRLKTLYWYTGYYAPDPPSLAWARKLSEARTKAVGKMEGMSLFVRILATGSMPESNLDDFTEHAVPAVNAVVGPQHA
jgi:EpsI family protein